MAFTRFSGEQSCSEHVLFFDQSTAFYPSFLQSVKVRDQGLLAYNLLGNIFHESAEHDRRLYILRADGELLVDVVNVVDGKAKIDLIFLIKYQYKSFHSTKVRTFCFIVRGFLLCRK